MQVETYTHEPQFPEVDSKDIETLELVSTLEALKSRQSICNQERLQHQVELIQEEINKVTTKIIALKSGVPYLLLTPDQWKILKNHFVWQKSVGDFEALVPYDVIRTYHTAKHLGVFHDITVAYHDRDPLLLGWNQKWDTPFLLSRWGDALHPWSWFTKEYSKRDGIQPTLFFIGGFFLVISIFLGSVWYFMESKPGIAGIASILLLAATGISGWAGIWWPKHSKLKLSHIPSPFKTDEGS
ncbi:MAG: hypothetical protein AAB581_02810 [Patescibacteria group bacterium]